MLKKINVCAYARVSTDSRDQENSYDNQKSYFLREIEKNNNYKLTEVYADKGLTATTTSRRKEFLRMVHDAGIDVDMYAYTHDSREKHEQVFTLSDRKPLFNKIFVKNTSRFARNIDIIDLLRKLRSKGVHVDFLDINKSTENETDFVFIEMLLVFDENDSRDKSRKVRFGQREGMEKGVIHTNSKLYGYKIIDKFNLEVIPEEAEVIKYIYETYAKGDGVRVIGNKLKEKGYKTRNGKNFGKTSIMNIIKNPKYRGDNVRNRYTTGTIFVDKTATSQEKPKEDWIVHEDVIPAIVSDELWQKCEDIRLSRNVGQRGVYFGRTKYAGLIKCGVCGANYHRNTDKGRAFYNCSTKRKSGVTACNNININEEEINRRIESLAEGEYKRFIDAQSKLNVFTLKDILIRLNDKLNEDIDNDEYKRYNLLLSEITEKKNKLTDLYLSDRIKLEYFDSKNEELTNQYQEIKNKVKYLLGGKELILEEIDKVNTLINNLEKVEYACSDVEYTTEEIIKEIDYIMVGKNQDSLPQLFIEYKSTRYMAELMRKYIMEA